MTRKVVLFALCLMSASCATPSNPDPVKPPAPVAVDPRLCAPLKPEPEPRGSIVAPASTDEALATGEHLDSDAEARDWGRQGWDRAALAMAAFCRL